MSRHNRTPAMAATPAAVEAAAQAPAAAAADFADGHVDAAAPVLTSGVAATALGTAPPDEIEADLIAMRSTAPAPHRVTVVGPRGSVDPPASIVTLAPGHILILCGTPGFRRAGFAHPSRAEYPLDAFTAEQLASISTEPVLEMVSIGGTPVPRATRVYGVEAARTAPLDPLLAGRAAADAISRPPNRAEPGLRNAVAGRL